VRRGGCDGAIEGRFRCILQPAIGRAVDAERRCCRVLRFAIVVEPDEGPIVLELTGPPGTREFVAALLEG
jgi:hypothetical protein